MKFGNMLDFLPAGKHFRRPEWAPGKFISLEKGRITLVDGDVDEDLVPTQEEMVAGDYEVC